MSTYDSYETVEVPRKHKSHRHHHHHDRDRDREREREYESEPRYAEIRETYVRGPAPIDPDSPYPSRATDLIRRPREDSDLSVEEVRRNFPPPEGAYINSRSMVRDDRYGPPVRSRSADRGGRYDQYLDDQREDRHSRRKVVKEEIIEPRRRSLSRNQKILAAVGGAALAVGGKELWDRRQNGGHAPEDRNLLATAAIGAAGAFGGYEGAELYTKKVAGRHDKKVKKETYMAYQGRNGEADEYYSTDTEQEKPEKKSRRKSIIEGALGLAGLGAAAKNLGGDHRDDRSDRSGRRSRRGSDSGDSRTSRRRDKSRGGEQSEGIAKFQQAAKAALLAGATEAFRVRNEPGGWGGAKGKRILTAAIGAGGIDAAADRDPDHHSKRHILEAVVGGLAGNRLLHGSRSELEAEGGKGGRSRSRSRGPSSSGGGGAGLAALATAGLGALAGKKLLDRSRSRSRGDDRDRDDRRSHRRRSPSDDGYSDDGKGRDRRRRSKSVTDMARKGLAALGIGEAASEAGHRDDRRRDREVVEETRETRVTRKPRKHHDSDDDSDYDDRRDDRRRSKRDVASTRGDPYGDSRDGGSGRRTRKQEGQEAKRVAEGKQDASDSDSLGSSSGDEKRVKKMKGKQFLTAGLATVATIHAGHNVYQSYEKRVARQKAVESGEMSPEEAKKLKAKAVLQDAASIGIAALGIKGAMSVSYTPVQTCLCIHLLTSVKEWKEMREMRHEYKEFEEKKDERHKKRLERQKQQKQLKQHGEGGGRDDRQRPSNASAPDLTYGGRFDLRQPYYVDGNPYASGGLPPPPVGYAYQPRR
jgi:hypothetical protein